MMLTDYVYFYSGSVRFLMGKLASKVAIVTGAARGHAEAVARRFAKEGAAVSICDVMPVQDLEAKVASEIRAADGTVICFETDVSPDLRAGSPSIYAWEECPLLCFFL